MRHCILLLICFVLLSLPSCQKSAEEESQDHTKPLPSHYIIGFVKLSNEIQDETELTLYFKPDMAERSVRIVKIKDIERVDALGGRAITYDRSSNWYQIKVGEDYLWLPEKYTIQPVSTSEGQRFPEEPFLSYERELLTHPAQLKTWDGHLFVEAHGKGQPIILKDIDKKGYYYLVTRTKKISGVLWLYVKVIDRASDCSVYIRELTPTNHHVLTEGWAPAFNNEGQPHFWINYETCD